MKHFVLDKKNYWAEILNNLKIQGIEYVNSYQPKGKSLWWSLVSTIVTRGGIFSGITEVMYVTYKILITRALIIILKVSIVIINIFYLNIKIVTME